MRKNVDWGRWVDTENILVVEVVVELEMEPFDVLERRYNLRICVKAAPYTGVLVLAQLAEGSDPGRNRSIGVLAYNGETHLLGPEEGVVNLKTW